MHKEFLMGNAAIALGAVAAGVNVVAGYPGTPSTEVLETVAKYRPDDVYVEWSVNEKAAMELAAGASYAGARSMVTMKQVGLNVASDPLMSLEYVGIKGGMVILVADDPGPISSHRQGIGKNGKDHLKMYKFRSMYMDAEERKAELMAQNKMSDGRMFKLDFDPRVIGNKILPDGTRKTGIGEFIRKTSLDEFPQFWNVLNGSMSLVGTRPILQDELLKYELHHRARIAIKPGITGMWQVSGRSDITDFEEVVRLDTEYISNWNFGLDIKILFKTVMTVLKREGSV